jgi:hypothetical protein
MESCGEIIFMNNDCQNKKQFSEIEIGEKTLRLYFSNGKN